MAPKAVDAWIKRSSVFGRLATYPFQCSNTPVESCSNAIRRQTLQLRRLVRVCPSVRIQSNSTGDSFAVAAFGHSHVQERTRFHTSTPALGYKAEPANLFLVTGTDDSGVDASSNFSPEECTAVQVSMILT